MQTVRVFELTQLELGVHCLAGGYFVYYRDLGDVKPRWHLYLGPFSSFDHARDSIATTQEVDLPASPSQPQS